MRSCLAAIFLILFLPPALQAQTAKPSPAPTPEDQEPVRVFTEEVRIPVAATDTYGHYDPTLNAEDVLVLEDGKPQQIRSIRHLPTNVLLVLDVGNQLGLKDMKLTRDLALRIVSTAFPGTRLAVMQFATRPELLQTWTTDRTALEKTLKTKISSGKSSRLSAALTAAADQFKDTAPGTRHIVIITDGVEDRPEGSRHVVMITDGVDTPGGKVDRAEAMRKLVASRATVHIISYTVMARAALAGRNKRTSGGDGVQRDGNPRSNPVANGDPTLPVGTTRTPSFKIGSIDTDLAMRRKRKEYERATRDSEKGLIDLAEESGGRIVLPDSNQAALEQAETITRDIGSQYVITYRPSRPLTSAKAGEYRAVEVASRRVGLYLRSRKGYVVSAASQ